MSYDSSSDCPKLTGPEVYQIWKVRIRGKLQIAKVWGVIDGTDPRPVVPLITVSVQSATPTLSPSTSPSADPDESPQQAPRTESVAQTPDPIASEKLREWHIRDARALGLITANVSDALAIELDDIPSQTAKTAYEHIIKKFEKTNAGATAFGTLLDLLDLRWGGASDTFEQHTGNFTKLSTKLTALGEPISPLFKSLFFLRSLPSTPIWDIFRTAMLNSVSDIKTLTYENIATRAAGQVSNANSMGNQTTGHETVLQASRNCRLHGPGTHSDEDCIVIKRLIQAEMQKRAEMNGGPPPRSSSKGPNTKKKKKGKESAKVAEEVNNGDDDASKDDSDSEYASHVYVSNESKSKIFACYLSSPDSSAAVIKKLQTLFDSACSTHMTPNSSWLLPGTLQYLSKPVAVHLGDDSVVKGIARGTMRFPTNKANDEFIEFRNTLLVPDLSTTLISIPTLARHGLKTLFDNKGGHIILNNLLPCHCSAWLITSPFLSDHNSVIDP
ncbi:hypothetical protein NMY22_g11716 [Coprinellus aureogranulatus]|nr:hypothetical protein NMY22_g11716 [Coprinellus aureogranulatus]